MSGHGAPLVLNHGSAITGRERNLIVGYEFDAQEGILINKEVTGAAGGSNGTIFGARQMRDRIHGKGLRFNGADYVTYTQAGDIHTAGTMIITVLPRTIDNNVRYIHSALNVNRWDIYFDQSDIYTNFGDTGPHDTGHNASQGKSFRIAVTWTSTHVWVYIDGILVDDYALNLFANDFATGYLGCDTTLANFYIGEQYEFDLIRRTLTAEEIAADYLKYADRARYQETLRACPVTSAPVLLGRIASSWWTGIGLANGCNVDIVDAPELARLSGVRGVKKFRFNIAAAEAIYIPTNYLGMGNPLDPEAGWGTWDFWMRKPDTAGFLEVHFASTTATPATATSLGLRIDDAESYCFRQYIGGALNAVLAFSAAGAYTLGDWVRITIVKDFRLTGNCYVFVNGILMDITGGGGANPSDEASVVFGSYVMVVCESTGAEFGLISHRWGAVRP